jgi:PAS domain S-box-containing protein
MVDVLELRPSTWPPSAYVLPIGVGSSVWMMRRGERRGLGLGLLLLGVAFLAVFRLLPRYTSPTWFGITRPALIFAPCLWVIVGWTCWGLRAKDRLFPVLALMAAVLVFSHVSMFYSRAPHDTQAMVAHLGRVGGYLILLLSLVQMASLDMRERIRAEQKLAQSNEDLERRVLARTAQLETINRSLEAEMTARRQAEERLRVIVEAAPNAMIMMGEDGHIVMVNAQVERLFGYERSELLGQTIEMLVPERFRVRHPGLRQRFFAAPVARPMGAGRDLHGLRKDGSEVPIEIGLNPITTAEGRFVLASIIDITERKQAEEEIRRLNSDLEKRVRDRTGQLEKANQELEGFAYSVAHDLRAPLRAVGGFSQLLAETYQGTLDEEGKRLLRVVRTEAERMGVLIDALLSFSRLGSQQIEVCDLDMTALARSSFQELTSHDAGRKPRLELQPLPPAQGEEALVRQVFVNLLSNAVKFTRQREDAVIEVGTSSDSGQNVYYVKDNGVGFDARYADKLFGVFQRLHSTAEFEGTGIGLALVQRIITRHGGRVWAESRLHEGATFYFTMPKQKETP